MDRKPSNTHANGHFFKRVCFAMPRLTAFPCLHLFSQALTQSSLFTHQTGSSLKGALFVSVAPSMDPL